MADKDTKKKGGSALGLIAPVLVLTLVAGGGGFMVGKLIVAKAKASVAAEAKPAETGPPGTASVAIKELPPIVANLSAPEGSWVRLQTAIVYDKADGPQIEVLASRISDDTLAFIRTLSVAQLQGASGLQHLREDLSERAAVRSDGHVKEMMIEMMVIQ